MCVTMRVGPESKLFQDTKSLILLATPMMSMCMRRGRLRYRQVPRRIWVVLPEFRWFSFCRVSRYWDIGNRSGLQSCATKPRYTHRGVARISDRETRSVTVRASARYRYLLSHKRRRAVSVDTLCAFRPSGPLSQRPSQAAPRRLLLAQVFWLKEDAKVPEQEPHVRRLTPG